MDWQRNKSKAFVLAVHTKNGHEACQKEEIDKSEASEHNSVVAIRNADIEIDLTQSRGGGCGQFFKLWTTYRIRFRADDDELVSLIRTSNKASIGFHGGAG